MLLPGTCLAALLLAAVPSADASRYFQISVVDADTGRGVPLVELRSVDGTSYWTDSQGLVAFFEPGQMNHDIFFHVKSDGYEFSADGFGFRGKSLLTKPGTSAELRIKRVNVAERLYRVTGAGIYRDTILLGQHAPIERPLLNAQVVGSDSVNSILFRGDVHWFWGDTNRLGYPLGMFHVPGATSTPPQHGGLDPRRGVNLTYYLRNDGFVDGTAEMPGDGPTWIDGLCIIREADGEERMFAKYVKVRKFLEVYERGLVEFNPDSHTFEKVTTFDFNAPLYPLGHAMPQTVDGVEYVYYGNPEPLVRVRASVEALRDPAQYEAFTCLRPGSSRENPAIDRDATGAIRYRWRRNTPAPTQKDQQRWLNSGQLKSGEELLALRDVESGKLVKTHAGSVSYNDYRRRYVMIAEELGGTSYLGEIWYAEADTPVGPWVYARKIVSHAKYSFYNPKHHAMFDQEGGRRIFFEGTYSTFFSGVEQPTPRYDYNQIMYSLQLDDPRLNLPVAVRQSKDDERPKFAIGGQGQVKFMACDRPSSGLLAIGAANNDGSHLVVNPNIVAFYGLPADVKEFPATTLALYEWTAKQSDPVWYGIDGESAPEGYRRSETPLCRVWRYPLRYNIP